MTPFIIKRWRMEVIVAGFVILILAVSVLYGFNVSKIRNFLGLTRGEDTKEMVVGRYIEGLKNNDAIIIKKLIPLKYNADEIIKAKIEQFKEADFDRAEINYNEDFSLVKVEVKGIKSKDGKTVSEQIYVGRDCTQIPGTKKCEKWYLMMGNLKEKHNPVIPSR